MIQKEYKFIPGKGTARITSDLNVRKGAPSAQEEIVKMLHSGMMQTHIGYVLDGDKIADNSTWFITPDGDFFWSGNVDIHTVDVLGRILVKPLDQLFCTQRFGERPEVYAAWGSPRGHNGIDFRTRNPANPSDWKRPVYAVLDGSVSEAAETPLMGKYVRLAHVNGYESVYLHLSSVEISSGQQVAAGTKIGISGNTGLASEAPHLHFGLRPPKYDKNNGTMGYIDPFPYFKDEVKFS